MRVITVQVWLSAPVGKSTFLKSHAMGKSNCYCSRLLQRKQFSEDIEFFEANAGIAGLGKTSFNILQGNYIVPSVLSYWQYIQNLYLQSIKDKGHHLKLGGDARCSSPGHTAKYGSYTFMDVETSKVIYIQLVQCNEVKNSNAMELEGLKRGLQFLKDEQIVVSDFITDRHVQVKKLMREEHPDIRHWFDVWHVAKGMFNEVIILCTKA